MLYFLASRLGRRPKKVMKSSSLSSSEFQTQISKHIDSKQNHSGATNSNNWDFPGIAQDALNDVFGCPPEMMEKLSRMMPAMMNGQMPSFPPGMGHPPGMMPGAGGGSNREAMKTPPVDLSMREGAGPPLPAMPMIKQEATEPITHMDLNKWREKQYEVMSKYMHNKDSGSVGDQSDVSSSDTISRYNQCKSDSPSGSAGLCSPLSVSSLSSDMPTSSDQDITVISKHQKERIMRYISYGTAPRQPEAVSLIKEVQSAITDSHMEHCFHQRPRINAVSAELDAREQVRLNSEYIFTNIVSLALGCDQLDMWEDRIFS